MSVLKIHMTYQCTAECEHCRFKCIRRPGRVIDYELAMKCIKVLKKINDLELVVLMGGEPGLFPELTNKLTRSISKLGLAIRVETNAFWAKTKESARQFLEPLYAEKASMMFSLDCWHEEFISSDWIENAIRVSDELGGKYHLEVAYLEKPGADNEKDKRTDELLKDMEKRLDRTPCAALYQGTILCNGRATYKLAADIAQGRRVPENTCNTAPWWSDGEFETLKLLILDPDGYLSKGCGIAMGNIKNESVQSVLESFDAKIHPIFSVLLKAGPAGLAKEAVTLGYVMKKDYADKCHLCQEVREFLREKNRYCEYLVPEQHYQ